jgi:hypothetical protein
MNPTWVKPFGVVLVRHGFRETGSLATLHYLDALRLDRVYVVGGSTSLANHEQDMAKLAARAPAFSNSVWISLFLYRLNFR